MGVLNAYLKLFIKHNNNKLFRKQILKGIKKLCKYQEIMKILLNNQYLVQLNHCNDNDRDDCCELISYLYMKLILNIYQNGRIFNSYLIY